MPSVQDLKSGWHCGEERVHIPESPRAGYLLLSLQVPHRAQHRAERDNPCEALSTAPETQLTFAGQYHYYCHPPPVQTPPGLSARLCGGGADPLPWKDPPSVGLFPHLQLLFHAGCQQGAPRAGFRWGSSGGEDGRQRLSVGRFVITALLLVVREGRVGQTLPQRQSASITPGPACGSLPVAGPSAPRGNRWYLPGSQKPRQELISHWMTQESRRSVSFFFLTILFCRPFHGLALKKSLPG